MRAYSVDLREKIVQAADRRVGSQRAIAETFGVSRSFVEKLLRRRRTTGAVAPAPHRGGHPRACDAAAGVWLRQRVQDHPDATLQELCTALAAERGIRVSVATMWAELRRLGLMRKKSDSMRRSGSAPRSSRHEKPLPRSLPPSRPSA